MEQQLQSIEEQVGKGRNYDAPPLHLWHPPLSGDIPIVITADGTWYHDGGKIERESLVPGAICCDHYRDIAGEGWMPQV